MGKHGDGKVGDKPFEPAKPHPDAHQKPKGKHAKDDKDNTKGGK